MQRIQGMLPSLGLGTGWGQRPCTQVAAMLESWLLRASVSQRPSEEAGAHAVALPGGGTVRRRMGTALRSPEPGEGRQQLQGGLQPPPLAPTPWFGGCSGCVRLGKQLAAPGREGGMITEGSGTPLHHAWAVTILILECSVDHDVTSYLCCGKTQQQGLDLWQKATNSGARAVSSQPERPKHLGVPSSTSPVRVL